MTRRRTVAGGSGALANRFRLGGPRGMLSGMALRDASYQPTPPDEPSPPDKPASLGAPTDEVRQWRVSSSLIVLKAIGAVVFTGAGVISGQPTGVAIALVAALLLAGHVIRDLLVPVRVAADPGGLTVTTGFAGHRRLDWAGSRIGVDERRRLGTRSRLLEIDTDETLYLFGESDLGAPVEAVARELRVRQRLACGMVVT